tara:strand:+ start:6075 stop:6380 length:306 start_codon:yes stop_codon:yes gene_type:complete
MDNDNRTIYDESDMGILSFGQDKWDKNYLNNYIPTKLLKDWIFEDNNKKVIKLLAKQPEVLVAFLAYLHNNQKIRLSLDERVKIAGKIAEEVKTRMEEDAK